ncbi:hypothetical protein, partial [Rhodopseudomonas sp. BR0G17]|uniref:hypothetical protein n=1 Tax=Rhodopseudomonas sp. BR0G17 TaxID=2269368 RepID=UPI0013DE8AED
FDHQAQIGLGIVRGPLEHEIDLIRTLLQFEPNDVNVIAPLRGLVDLAAWQSFNQLWEPEGKLVPDRTEHSVPISCFSHDNLVGRMDALDEFLGVAMIGESNVDQQFSIHRRAGARDSHWREMTDRHLLAAI